MVPGGLGGVQTLRQDESVKQAVREFMQAGKIVASLCAGPVVLHDAGVLVGKTFTSYPGNRGELTGGTWVDQPVVRDGNLLTSQAAGTAFAFALALAEVLAGREMVRKVAAGMVFPFA